jgi:hypothetical protein
MIKVLCSIFFFILTFVQTLCSQTDSIIPWDKDFVLTIEHFRGKSRPRRAQNGASIYGQTWINPKWNKPPYYDVGVGMNIDKSWFLDTINQSPSRIVHHEKLHFDIYELGVRQIRKEFHRMNLMGIRSKEKYKRKAQNLFKKYDEINKEFDKQSRHGQLHNVELEWRKKVDRELKKLEKYQSRADINNPYN